ncbi:AAA family ATPase [Nonomuraea fuscirosea]|uniref:ATP-binding protein n=1 Tax=Nonomuraea fuscirosea TaxID=1291556 RepID=UPI002DD86EB6|nr:AAA family ATPase [Nonomuraea fuscirosea]WSA55953.1 AAA family ATPase [Nonomuraea fuscirosea]
MNKTHVRRRAPSDALPPALIGRDDAMAAMVAAVSEHALVLVEGESGIGKSRLLDECLADPGLRGRTVLMAACPPLREPFPLGAVVDGLRAFHERLGELALSPLAGALRTLFPEWASWLPPALEALPDPQETRHRLFRALGELIDALGVDVLVVEDAHWADAATLDWLLTLTTSRGAARSIVVTYRPLEVGEGSPLLRLTSRPPRNMSWERIALEPLDVPQTGALVKSMFATADVSDHFAAFLHEHTGGIPLALEETVRLLRARRDIFRSESGWRRRITEELRVPPTVRDSVLERVTRLDPLTRAVLEAAAVLETPAGEALIAAVADLDEAAVQDGLAGALASGLLRESGRGAFGFNHVLASRAVAEAIPIPSRRRLHHRAALALREGEHPPVVRLCHHFRESGDVEEWCRYAEAAAELAMEAGDGHTTVVMMLDLLTAADHPVERLVRLAGRLGAAVSVTAEPLLGLGERVRAALEETLAHPGLPAGARGELGLRLGRLRFHLGEFEAAMAGLEAAMPDLADRPDLAVQAMLLLANPMIRAWPRARHLEWAGRAEQLFPLVGLPVERAAFLSHQAAALLCLGEEDGWRVARALPADGDSRLERQEIARGRLMAGQFCTLWGRHDDARAYLDSTAALVERAGYRRIEDALRLARAHLAWHAGHWDGLDDVAAELAGSETADEATRLEARMLLGCLDLARGVPQRAEQRLREVLAASLARGHADPFIFPDVALARILLARGEPEAALEITEPLLEMIVRKDVWLWATELLPVHLDALPAVGRTEERAGLAAAFAAGMAGRDAPAVAAAVVTCQAMVAAGPEEAAGLFARAAAMWAALPRPYDALLAAERQGRRLLDAGERERALKVLEESQRELAALGARWDADRVAHLLREQGVEVARPWRGGRKGYGDRLSPREVEIVRLAALGWTNKRIAESLTLSPRTVERHLSAAMRKLSVTTRTALVTTAAADGLLDETPT